MSSVTSIFWMFPRRHFIGSHYRTSLTQLESFYVESVTTQVSSLAANSEISKLRWSWIVLSRARTSASTFVAITLLHGMVWQGRLSPQRQWCKLPLPFPPPSPPLSLPSLPPLPGGLGHSPQWRGSGVLPGKNWNRIWCILAHFCFKTAAIYCFTFCEQKLNEFFTLQGVILFPLSPIWTQVASTSPR